MNRSFLHRIGRFFLPILCLVVILAIAPDADAATADMEGAAEAILQCYEDQAESVDLTQYKLTPEQLDDIFNSYCCAGMYPWYADWYSCTTYTDSGLVATYYPVNLDPDIYDYNLYEQKVAEILEATVFPGMSDWQIALAIHDYLVAHITYDETLTYYQGYDGIVNGYTVCNGYSEAYQDLLTRVGIPCHKVISDESQMNHAWNLVYVSGNWLHVDTTWDDPISDTEGRVLHDYFLISDKTISDSNHNHYGWDSDITCSFTGWDSDLFWHGVDDAICYESSEICYLRIYDGKSGYTLYRLTASTGEWKVITSYDAGYIDIGGSTQYNYFYHSYGLSLYEGRLYYADMGNVYSIKPDGSGKKTVYTHDNSSKKTYIAGCHVQDGILYLTFSDHSGNLTSARKDLGISKHTHSYTKKVVAATCVSQGYTRYSCSCGISYDADYTPISDTHRYKTTTVAATCVSQGYDHHVCSDCGDSYDDHYVDKLPHSYETETVLPTCTEKGYDLLTCTSCGYSYRENYTSAHHSYGEGVVIREATEDSDGLLRYTCSVCGGTMNSVIPKLESQTPSTGIPKPSEDNSHGNRPSPTTEQVQDPTTEAEKDPPRNDIRWDRVALIVLVIVVLVLLGKKSKKKKAKATAVPVAAAAKPTRFCIFCGGALDQQYSFCPYCGKKLGK